MSAAQAAFKSGPWSTYTGSQRAKCMLKFADLIDANAAKLAELDSITMGAPTAIGAGFLIPAAAAAFRCMCQSEGRKSVLTCERLRRMGRQN